MELKHLMITAIFANAAKSGPICGCSLKLPSPIERNPFRT